MALNKAKLLQEGDTSLVCCGMTKNGIKVQIKIKWLPDHI